MWGVLRIWSEWGSGARDPAGDGCAAGTDVWRPAAPPPGPGHGATWGGVGVQDDKGWEDGGQQLRESSSAYECGLVRDGDILNSVEGQSVENLPVAAIHMMLLGAQDSWVQMKFMRQTDAKEGPPLAAGVTRADAGERRFGHGVGEQQDAVIRANLRYNLRGPMPEDPVQHPRRSCIPGKRGGNVSEKQAPGVIVYRGTSLIRKR
eukprot:CAMPEP_0180262480 /NCGR_PEP_ID=MMETSP0987-20121128/44737_1 /TAXON_ID=697907 /ORGANISM="non described non described, Strain CCMP2293" /LENGTH=204 /DNA_ID=CAMNT_0022232579 /DNA_START=74 /DNA_END=686 /DNA_ORIENTATION=+